jgi:hypothetical protein
MKVKLILAFLTIFFLLTSAKKRKPGATGDNGGGTGVSGNTPCDDLGYDCSVTCCIELNLDYFCAVDIV